ncbi:esterase FrsA [Vibrio mexicanus]|uniref:esterase FrsA n=1 Tax=Vibrio mexicanus TaxID=1004326 RepID=UPI00063C4FAA|nr:esterase FrsA [Vibrio mexicanus]
MFARNKLAKETSALTRYLPSSEAMLEEKNSKDNHHWYRNLRKLQWVWQGVDPIEQEAVLSKIASSTHDRSHDEWLDTVAGYRSGNWAYEWTKLGAAHQKRGQELDGDEGADELFQAALCFSIAGYPHIKGDNLAIQTQVLANAAYTEGAKKTRYTIKTIEVPFKNKKVPVNLHLPATDKPYPVVIVSAGLDSLQTDMWRLFRDHLAPKNIAMLTVDLPSVGQSNRWPLNHEFSDLHHAVLEHLPTLPWVNHRRIGLLGFRFGGNAMVRLSFLAPDQIKACVALGAPVHDVFSSPNKLKKMSKMYLDVLASRMGKDVVDIDSMSGLMSAWSLKVQGVLGSRKTKVPILAMSLDGDPVSPHSDNQLVALYSMGGRAKKIESKTITKGYEQSLDLAIKWLEDELI